MSSLASFPFGRLSYPAEPVRIPNSGAVRLKIEVRGAALQFFYALGADTWIAIGPVLDASLLSDECGGHPEHGSFTGAFVGMAASDLNGTAREANFTGFVYRPVHHETDRY